MHTQYQMLPDLAQKETLGGACGLLELLASTKEANVKSMGDDACLFATASRRFDFVSWQSVAGSQGS